MKEPQQIGWAIYNKFRKVFYGDRVTHSVTKKNKSLITRRRINCSVTAEEFKKILFHAKQTDLSPTAFFKKAVFSYLENENILPKTQEKILRDFILQFRKIGNNLNQIARQTNRVKQVVNFFDLKKELQRLRVLENAVQRFISNPPKK